MGGSLKKHGHSPFKPSLRPKKTPLSTPPGWIRRSKERLRADEGGGHVHRPAVHGLRDPHDLQLLGFVFAFFFLSVCFVVFVVFCVDCLVFLLVFGFRSS